MSEKKVKVMLLMIMIRMNVESTKVPYCIVNLFLQEKHLWYKLS